MMSLSRLPGAMDANSKGIIASDGVECEQAALDGKCLFFKGIDRRPWGSHWRLTSADGIAPIVRMPLRASQVAGRVLDSVRAMDRIDILDAETALVRVPCGLLAPKGGPSGTPGRGNLAGRRYMYHLTFTIAQCEDVMRWVTDAQSYAECESILQFDAVPRDEQTLFDPDGTSILMRLGIPLPTREQLEHVSLEKIVDHHDKRQNERRGFRQAIEGIISTASNVTDPVALEDLLADRRRTIEQQIGDYKKTLDEINVSAVSSVMDITVPAWGLAAIDAGVSAGTGVGLALAGFGLTVKAVQWWAKVRHDRREAVASCPWHYCMETQRRFGRA